MKMDQQKTNSLVSRGKNYVLEILRKVESRQKHLNSGFGNAGRASSYQKGLAVFLAFAMFVLQIIPAGIAAEQVKVKDLDWRPTVQANDQVHAVSPSESIPSGTWIPKGALSAASGSKESATNVKIADKINPIAKVDSPPDRQKPALKPIVQESRNETRDQELPEVTAARNAVVQALADRFGFSKEKINEWLKKGLMKIAINMAKSLPPIIRGATVSFSSDFNLNLQPGEVNPFDPSAGLRDLPKEITYELNHEQVVCVKAPCVDNITVKNVQFKMNGLLYTGVPVYHPMNIMPGDRIMTHMWSVTNAQGHEVRRIQYFGIYGQKPVWGETKPVNTLPQIVIQNLDGSLGDFAVREIYVDRDKEGAARITALTDKDLNGNVLVRSQFNYDAVIAHVICLPGKECPQPGPRYFLNSIVRTDAQGNTLSEIFIRNVRPLPKPQGPGEVIAIKPAVQPFSAEVVLADGSRVAVDYSNLFDLLSTVEKLEKQHTELPEIRAAREVVIRTLMDRFGFSQERIKEWLKLGLIKIDFTMMKSLPPIVTGATLSFSRDFNLNLRPGEVNPFDPSAGNEVPKEIHFNLIQERVVCVKAPCSQQVHVTGITFQLNGLTYRNEPVHHIMPTNQPVPVSRWVVTDRAGREVRRITYFSDAGVIPTKPNLYPRIVIENLDGSLGNFATREVFTARNSDGTLRITSLADRKSNGTLIAKSTFNYSAVVAKILCLPNAKCVQPEPVYMLDSIVRTDAKGAVLSKIKITNYQAIQKPGTDKPIAPLYNLAIVSLPDGRAVKVEFKNLTELLIRAAGLERQIRI